MNLVQSCVLRQVAETPEQARPTFARKPFDPAIVEETFDIAEPRLFEQPRSQLTTDPVCADDDLAAPDTVVPEKPAGEPPRRRVRAGKSVAITKPHSTVMWRKSRHQALRLSACSSRGRLITLKVTA
jgi:hypothetical protein